MVGAADASIPNVRRELKEALPSAKHMVEENGAWLKGAPRGQREAQPSARVMVEVRGALFPVARRAFTVGRLSV